MQTELENASAVVVGHRHAEGAMTLVRRDDRIDATILDVNLAGEMVFPLADLLLGKAMPVVFATGYDVSVIPERFGAVVRHEKPVDIRRMAEALDGKRKRIVNL